MKKKKLTYAQAFAQSGGRARAASLSPERRKEIGKMGAAARWARAKSKGAERE